MIQFGFKLDQAKGAFFDRGAVMAVVDKATRRNLARAGGFIRQTARRSMRRAPKKVGTAGSPPGSPPYTRARSGDFASLRSIFFSWDAAARSVVVGPALLNGSAHQSLTVPELHEHGGERQVVEVQTRPGGPWLPIKSKSRRSKIVAQRTRRARYPARPYMEPALTASLERVTDPWRDSIRRAA